MLAQLRITPQMWNQRLVTFGHIEHNRRSNLAQIPQRFLERTRHRLTFVQVQSSAIVKDHSEILAAGERVVPRQPFEDYGWLVLQKMPAFADLLLIAGPHAVGIDDSLRHARGSGGEQNLEDRVWSDLRVRLFERGSGRCRSQ